MAELHISFAAEKIIDLHTFGIPFSITNSMFTAVVVLVLLSLVLLNITSNLSKIPSYTQAVLESVYLYIYSLVETILPKHIALNLFPLLLALFLYILFGSWIGLLPGAGTLGFIEEHDGEKVSVPIFRAITADLNATIGLALVVFFVVEYQGIKALGFRYFKKFFDFSSPVGFFVGFLELIQEFTRVISFSMRLFGNIFAGEVILAVILSLAGFFVLPFLAFEVFVGLIQSFVFVMLTTVFVGLAVESHEDHSASSH